MRTSGLICATSFALMLAAALPAKEVSEYQIGDLVEADITAPASLVVVNAEVTEALKQKEPRIPAIFVYHPAAVDEVEQDFRAAFSAVRSNFFDVMGAVYKRKRLNLQQINSPRFKELSTAFRRQHPAFPQLTYLIILWARGQTEEAEAIQNALVARLREAMDTQIRADELPPGIKLSSQSRLMTATSRDEALTLKVVERHTTLLHSTNLLTLSRVRLDFQQLMPAAERAQAGFLASFLKPNCLLNVALTRESRRRAVGSLRVTDRYEAGQLIARRGQRVDAKIMAALAQLKTASRQTPRPENGSPVKVVWRHRVNPWWWTGLALVVTGLIFGSWQLLNRWKPASILPARVASGGVPVRIISCPSCHMNITLPAEAVENLSANTPTWRQRALTAERRAEQAHAAIRAGVLPHLADEFKQKFIRGLVSERSQMLDAQKSAATELAELERRLEDLHAPLQERLHTYEKRIAELEKLLAVKSGENRKHSKPKLK